jgi:tetratricopeptide (TPR) repeat protein
MKIWQSHKLLAILLVLTAMPGLLFAQTPPAPAQAPAAEAVSAATSEEGSAEAADPSAVLFQDAPAATLEQLNKANALVAEGKWLSAWKGLSEFDAKNADPFILAKKIWIALDGNAVNTLHLVFGFVDLAAGEGLDDVRAAPGDNIEPIEFDPGELARVMEEKGEAMPPVLSLYLGDYYFTVYTQYKGQWLQDDATIMAKAVENYDRALAYNVFSTQSLGNHVKLLVELQKFDGAEIVLKKALEGAPEDHALLLQLADVYLGSGKTAEVYPVADKIIAAPANETELNDAYVLAIRSGLADLNKEVLDKYVAAFEKSFPKDYMPGLVRHLVAIKLDDKAGADAAADAVTAAFPGNPDVVRTLLSSWLQSEQPEPAFRYLDRTIATNPPDEAMAALYFYRALMSAETAQETTAIQTALKDLAKAEEYFKKNLQAFPEGSEIYQTIEQLRAEWDKMLNPPAEATAPAETPADATTAATAEAE